MRVLVTGFGPFPGVPANLSEAAVRVLQRRADAGEFDFELITEVLPVDFSVIPGRLRDLIAEEEPDLVIATGVDMGAKAIAVERVAVNLVDARMPDSSGAQPVDRPVVEGGPGGYLATLPVKAVRAALLAAGLPAELSLSAGTYGCNAAMYAVLHFGTPTLRGGFLHVPSSATLAPERVADGIVAAIRACAAHSTDLDEIGGEIA
nr:pyroglutamyl-peptidase I [Actinomycetales bacterium]